MSTRYFSNVLEQFARLRSIRACLHDMRRSAVALIFLGVLMAFISNPMRAPYRGKAAQMYWQFCQFTHKLPYSTILLKNVIDQIGRNLVTLIFFCSDIYQPGGASPQPSNWQYCQFTPCVIIC